MMNCIKCMKTIPDDAAYCCYCGAKQEQAALTNPTKIGIPKLCQLDRTS